LLPVPACDTAQLLLGQKHVGEGTISICRRGDEIL
jgi:hypothetical protein